MRQEKRPIKIGLDVQLFLRGEKTGIGWCAANLIQEILKDREYQCELNFFSFGYKDKQVRVLDEYVQRGAKKNACFWFHDTLYKVLWPFLHIPYWIFFGTGQDIVQFFNFVIPPGIKGKKITVIHDLAYISCPETVKKKTLCWLKLTMPETCARADHIITVSEFSKSEIVKYLQVNPKKITVVPNAVNAEIFHPNYEIKEIENIKQKFGIVGEFFLYLGTLEPRKNISGILQAYEILYKKSTDTIPKLVLAGGKGWMYEEIFAQVKLLDLEEAVIFTGYVGDREAPVLMNGALAFVFPSLYEGFGMPPLEAMACGTPVVVSNTSSLPEVVGDAGILVSPGAPAELAEAMERLWKDKKLREQYRDAGIKRARLFNWVDAAERLKQVYREILN